MRIKMRMRINVLIYYWYIDILRQAYWVGEWKERDWKEGKWERGEWENGRMGGYEGVLWC